jgi:hypothetical protein
MADQLGIILVKQLADSVYIPIFVVAPNGIVTFFNEPAELIIEKRFEETGPIDLQKWCSLLDPRDSKGNKIPLEQLPISITLEKHIPDNNDFWIKKRGEENSHVYITCFPIIDKSNVFIGAICMFWEERQNEIRQSALDLAEAGIDTTISVRSPVSIVPRDVNGRPVQLTAKKLAKIPFGIGDWLGTQIRRWIIGDLTKFGVPMSKVHPAVQLRETGKTPVVDIGTAQAIKEGKIKVIGEIKGFYKDGVVLQSGELIAFDRVVLATGYKAQLTDFIPGIAPFLDKYGLPVSSIGSGAFSHLFFVGYDNYKLGGILGTIHSDSKMVVEAIVGSQGAVETG